MFFFYVSAAEYIHVFKELNFLLNFKSVNMYFTNEKNMKILQKVEKI